MGFVIVVVGAVYLLISIGVVAWAVSYANKAGKSAKKWGWGAALVMWLIPFWDWLPTVAVHQYYCATESGFWVYKTLDQWKAENPGVAETLTSSRVSPSTHQDNGLDHTTTYLLNQRFNWVVRKTGALPFNRWRWEQVVADSKTNEVLTRYVDFSTGNGFIGGEPELRFWLHIGHCDGGDMNGGKLSTLVEAAYNLGK
jgi:hypothetical protein